MMYHALILCIIAVSCVYSNYIGRELQELEANYYQFNLLPAHFNFDANFPDSNLLVDGYYSFVLWNSTYVEFWLYTYSTEVWAIISTLTYTLHTVKAVAKNDEVMVVALESVDDYDHYMIEVYQVREGSLTPTQILNMSVFNNTILYAPTGCVAMNFDSILAVSGTGIDSTGYVILYSFDGSYEFVMRRFFTHAYETQPSVYLTENTLMYITSPRTIRFIYCTDLDAGCSFFVKSTFPTYSQAPGLVSLGYCGLSSLSIDVNVAAASCSSNKLAIFKLQPTGAWILETILSGLDSSNAPVSVSSGGDRILMGGSAKVYAFRISTSLYTYTFDYIADGADSTRIVQVGHDENDQPYTYVSFLFSNSYGNSDVVFMYIDQSPTAAPTFQPSLSQCNVVSYTVNDGTNAEYKTHMCQAYPTPAPTLQPTYGQF